MDSGKRVVARVRGHDAVIVDEMITVKLEVPISR